MTNSQKISVGICVLALVVLLWPINRVWHARPDTNIYYERKQFYVVISQYYTVFHGNFATAVICSLIPFAWGRTEHYDLVLYHYHDGQLEKTIAKDLEQGSTWMYQEQFYYCEKSDPDGCSDTLTLHGTKMTRLDCASAKEANRVQFDPILVQKGDGSKIEYITLDS